MNVLYTFKRNCAREAEDDLIIHKEQKVKKQHPMRQKEPIASRTMPFARKSLDMAAN